MEGGAANWVALNFALNAVSGSGEMFRYLPDARFSMFAGDTVVTLYSHFGRAGVDPAGFAGNFQTSDGFEEWAVRVGVDFCDANPNDPLCNSASIPEPGTLALLGLGLGLGLGLAGLGFTRRRKA